MQVIIRPDRQAPDLAQGYALAETREEAFAMVGHPDTMVFWQHPRTPWPGEHAERLMWTSGWPVRSGTPISAAVSH